MKKSQMKLLVAPVIGATFGLIGLVGGTLAYFTSESQHDISISTGKVNITSNIVLDSLKTYSLGVEQTVPGTFQNGGSATLTDTGVALNLVTPGDKVEFQIELKNNSTVEIGYRMSYAFANEQTGIQNGLVPNPGDLVTGTKTLSEGLAISADLPSGYVTMLPTETEATFNVFIELPHTAGNEYQGATSMIYVYTEAIQRNAIPDLDVIEVNPESPIVAKDNGYYHEANIDGNLIDLIGYEEANGKFAKISQKTYGSVTYKGMLFNRSLINSIESIYVKYTGSMLHYSFMEYLMEDMSFVETGANSIPSGQLVTTNNSKTGYFVLFTSGEAVIESLEINYVDDASLTESFIYNNESQLGNGRSAAKNVVQTASFIEMENNPTNSNNNYSSGSTSGHDNTWYRWNGKEFKVSEDLGDKFDIHVTIAGNISQMVNSYANEADNFFHFAVWPEFSKNGENPNNDNWIMTYIGNDNYEPQGADSANRVHTDHYSDYSYAGRFFTRYEYVGEYQGNDDWEFIDPDTNNTVDDSKTLRAAFAANALPFWHVVFSINNGRYSYSINGFEIESDILFWEYNDAINDWDVGYDAATDSTSIYRFCMQTVNYGNGDRTAAASYKSMFTYPRVVKY